MIDYAANGCPLRLTIEDLEKCSRFLTYQSTTLSFTESIEFGESELFEDVELFSPPIALPIKNLRAPDFIGNHLTVFRKREENEIQDDKRDSIEVGRDAFNSFRI